MYFYNPSCESTGLSTPPPLQYHRDYDIEELMGDVSCRREARLEAAAMDPILIPPDPETPLPTLLVWPRLDPMPLREPRLEAGVPRTDPADPVLPV